MEIRVKQSGNCGEMNIGGQEVIMIEKRDAKEVAAMIAKDFYFDAGRKITMVKYLKNICPWLTLREARDLIWERVPTPIRYDVVLID